MTDTPSPRPVSPFKRWAPLALLVLAIAATYATGLQHYLSLTSIAANYETIKTFVAEHFWLAILAYAGVYVVVVALSVPGATILSILGGFLFGWLVNTPVTVVAATIGATIIFAIVTTSLGIFIAERAGPFVQKLAAGFRDDAFNYLLFLRLVPAFPFFAVNAVAGLARIPLATFVIATFIGIIPGVLAFSWIGAGLGEVIEGQFKSYRHCVAAQGSAACSVDISPMSLASPQLLIGLFALAVIALVPIVLKRLKTGKTP
jgi:uncharacterized membrane protein YdjX (TVP38/TMEM64 family)